MTTASCGLHRAEYGCGVDLLELRDGRMIELGDRATNGSKNETRFGSLDGQPVVVKIQSAHGDPRREEQALTFLATAPLRVPKVVGCGTTPTGRPFLAISREDGTHTETPAGWARFGRDLAALASVAVNDCPLRRVPIDEFLADHHERLATVRDIASSGVADEIEVALSRIAAVDRVVLTHGDPGSGNYLDSGADDRPGVLLDWETATVSPLGLDLGRAAFICMLDLHHTGVPDQLYPELIRGYLEDSELAGQFDRPLVSAWIAIAALQFIHGRHVRPLAPERTPESAATVFANYLSTRSSM